MTQAHGHDHLRHLPADTPPAVFAARADVVFAAPAHADQLGAGRLALLRGAVAWPGRRRLLAGRPRQGHADRGRSRRPRVPPHRARGRAGAHRGRRRRGRRRRPHGQRHRLRRGRRGAPCYRDERLVAGERVRDHLARLRRARRSAAARPTTPLGVSWREGRCS